MTIIVCIKQVPDTNNVRINPETNTLIREGVASIINPFDMYAIEEAVRLKEKLGAKAIVLCMGPPQAEEALREALSLGIDEAILVCDRAFAGSDTWATSYTLSKAIEKIGEYSLIICGKQAADGDTAQVGPGIAAHLDLPQVTYVKKIEEIDQKRARVESMTEEGYEIIETPLPVLITVVKEINTPRLPSLKGKMRARSANITIWSAKDLDVEPDCLGLNGSPTRVVKIFTPPARCGGQKFTGEPAELTEKLIQLLKDEIL
ncbi:MAG: electron transfer flavoprotein subunit beta [Candidatus Omnitrophica bacterium CG_4_8_14_3_um_filter_43_15]|nr:MAG: electron transfer flavoprotein subunit beta [Candidatus Omnitrophica bacterium CG1_02_43_210]PIR65599.1 MAG: electron transfer flavoprotein subunit beta [Candidatus Omnitrophica bacterium CG10_big_fil_rev_8_21_14_0_10_43_8]PIV11792.1 MAG: electron transfer flavoprotein subunit beta [Candidatus Omnitrophica bacterium CG03_land_8_20_14_0_80_43_22]PIW80485.1 MAG: electron transfer flavoprotein subunit beta [Candidatus Omnitrophica bacterium CG_4_8_14_3_um_filter_43_15]